MNYANMIEEKHLKKGYIIATLISTVIGTFTASVGLYERIRDQRRQHKKDSGQDEKITKLERRIDAADRAWRRTEWDKNLGWEERDLRNELAASGPMIRHEYDRNYGRFGSRFAEGDQIAQNELQAQIIEMQASVIRLLQDALVDGTMPDPVALCLAASRARNGSIRALNDQYQRMLTTAPVDRGTVYIPGSVNSGTARRALRSSSVASASTRSAHAEAEPASRRRASKNYYGRDRGRERRIWDDDDAEDEHDRDVRRRDVDRPRRSMSQATAGTRRASMFPVQPPASSRVADALTSVVAAQPPLFCRYAIQLQKDRRRPLALGGEGGSSHSEKNFDADASWICPACMGSFAIEHGRSWKMHKPVVVGEEIQHVEDTDAHDDVGGGTSNADGDGMGARTVATARRRKNIVELVQDRLFVVSNSFIVKCHRPAAYDGLENKLLPPSYACSLCDQFDADGKVTLCSSMARLVNHVCEKHSVGELLSDPDIREIQGRRER